MNFPNFLFCIYQHSSTLDNVQKYNKKLDKWKTENIPNYFLKCLVFRLCVSNIVIYLDITYFYLNEMLLYEDVAVPYLQCL